MTDRKPSYPSSGLWPRFPAMGQLFSYLGYDAIGDKISRYCTTAARSLHAGGLSREQDVFVLFTSCPTTLIRRRRRTLHSLSLPPPLDAGCIEKALQSPSLRIGR